MSTPHRVDVEAPAKINLTLRILHARADGFHELETVFQAVALSDRLEMRRRRDPGVGLRVVGEDLGAPEDNLVTRAARAYLEAAALEDQGVDVRLEKSIPSGAGLGGGSSDAGATLRAMDALFARAVPLERLTSLAVSLGSDVGFFVGSAGLAAAGGRGERLRPLSPLPAAGVVVGLPPVKVATGSAYGRLDRHRAGSVPPPVLGDAAPAAWSEVAQLAVNDFEEVVLPGYPPVAQALRALREDEPLMALLSGSGSAVFAVHPDLDSARAAAGRARQRAPETRFVAVSTLPHIPAPRIHEG